MWIQPAGALTSGNCAAIMSTQRDINESFLAQLYKAAMQEMQRQQLFQRGCHAKQTKQGRWMELDRHFVFNTKVVPKLLEW